MSREVIGGIVSLDNNNAIESCFYGLGFRGTRCVWVAPGKENQPPGYDFLAIGQDYLDSEEYWNRYYRERPVDREWCIQCCNRLRSTYAYTKTWQVLCEDKSNDGILDTMSINRLMNLTQFEFPIRNTKENYMSTVNCSVERDYSEDQTSMIGYEIWLGVKEHSTTSMWNGVISCRVKSIYQSYKSSTFSRVYDGYQTLEIIHLTNSARRESFSRRFSILGICSLILILSFLLS